MADACITPSEWQRFYTLRKGLFDLIERVDDGYHKSYEGAIDVTIAFDDIFSSDGPEDPPVFFILEVHCYLLINGRHERYTSESFSECLDKFEFDLKCWERSWEDE